MSDSTEGRRPIDPAAHSSTPAASVVEVHPRFLDESGLSLSAAAGSDLLLTVVTARAESLLASGLARLTRRSAPPRTVPLTDAPVARIAAARARDPKSLLVVHQRSETPDAIVDDLVGASADLVITTGAHESSISSDRGRTVVRLTADLPGSATHEGDEETLQWDLRLSRSASAKNRLLLHLDARAVTQTGGRPLTSDETARIYTDALQESDRTQQFLELVDGWADESAGHLTVDLTACGALELPPLPPASVQAGWEGSSARFDVDPSLLATPRILRSELTRRGFRVKAPTANYTHAQRSDDTIDYYFSNSHRAPQTAVRAAADKGVARAILARAGVPVADGHFFSDRARIADAEALLGTLGAVVVKPADAGHGNGVTVGVRTAQELRTAWGTAFNIARSGVLVERHVTGVEARFMVVGDTCVSVSCARPPRIVGDGRQTIRQLITALNDVRRGNPLLVSRPLVLDGDRIERMRAHGFTPLTVLPAGHEYDVATDSSWYGGTTTQDITDEVHPSYTDAAVRAVRAIPGLAVAGLDVIMEDFTQPADRSPFAVLEVNSQPGLGLPHFPMIGAARNPAGAIIDADLAPRRSADFSAVPAPGTVPGPRPAAPHATTAAIGAELERLGFDLDWFADDYLHAHRDGISTAVWKTYTTLSGKSAASAAQHAALSHRLLARAGVAVPRSWKSFNRDATATRFRNGRDALAYAATLSSPALQAANRDYVPVDATDEEAFRSVWHRVGRSGRRGVAVAEAPVGARFHVLVMHDAARSVRPVSAEARSAPAVHPSYLEVARRACAAFRGLELAEVVLHLEDPAAPAAPGNHVVSAVRTTPDLRKHQAIVESEGRSVFQEFAEGHVEQLLEELGRN